MAELFGKNYLELIEWLLNDWWDSKPGICIIEGFPGVGKTQLAEEIDARVKKERKVLTAWCECPERTLGFMDDLTLTLADSFAKTGEDSLADKLNLNAVPGILDKPMLLVIDEFQRSLLSEDARPEKAFAKWLGEIHKRNGRVILLSSRTVAQGRWSERFTIRRLQGLQPQEGADLLAKFLKDEAVPLEDIPHERRVDISKWLGGNPRALHLLATRLRFEGIDDLIGIEPESWQGRDREVSQDFLRRFEEELLSRARKDLDESVNLFFGRLAVYRRPVDSNALKVSNQGFGDVDNLRDKLIERFMIEFRRGLYTMHPVLRETELSLIDPSTKKTAHKIAGAHYARHFKAKQITGTAAKLGSAFIEARYHLTRAEDDTNLRVVIDRFEQHIRNYFKWVTPVPSESAELEERIALLLPLLQKKGAPRLHYYLARLLERRDAPGDRKLAAKHAADGTGPQSPMHAWLLRIRLEEHVNGYAAALAVAREGIRLVPVSQSLFSLYQKCGELMMRANKKQEAIDLLKEGIGRIPPDKSLYSLYQACGELLAQNNQTQAAIKLLKEGIGRIPPDKNLFSLYQDCGALLAREGKAQEAIELLKEGIGEIPQRYNRHRLVESAILLSAAQQRNDWIDELLTAKGTLELQPPQHLSAEVVKLQIEGNWEGAASKASLIAEINPKYFAVYSQEAFSWLCAGNPEKAQSSLDRFPAPLKGGKGSHIDWLRCYIALRNGETQKAQTHYAGYMEQTAGLSADNAPTEKDLLKIWDTPPPISTPHPSYYFPILPTSLTGLPEPVCRSLQGVPVFPPDYFSDTDDEPKADKNRHMDGETNQKGKAILAVATEWFSRKGGISTFNRELCVSLAGIGYRVACFVPVYSEEERVAAQADGVLLVDAPKMVTENKMDRLYNRPRLPEDFIPDTIIGHGRITGNYAKYQVDNFFEGAKRIHFVHMIADEIECHKNKTGAAKTAETRTGIEEDLCENAALIAAVGPRILRAVDSLAITLPGSPGVHCFIPGIKEAIFHKRMPLEIQCLILGRAEDLQLKGLDIAARALAKLFSLGLQAFDSFPILSVRGAPRETGDELRNTLKEIAQEPIDIRVREYTADQEEVTKDLKRSSVLLMPSRAEGFGLVALEALSIGIPILVSDKSGIGEFLKKQLDLHLASNFVVTTTGDLETDADKWCRALERVFLDRDAAFRRAQKLHEKLKDKFTWENASRELMDALGETDCPDTQ